MRESPADIERLQRLLDDSYATAGEHLRSIHTDAARVSAGDMVALLDGMQILVLATVTADGRPVTGPVDGFLYRGRWHFGTSPSAVRTKHLARSPAVSATHVRGETLVVTVHGVAQQLDFENADRDFRQFLVAHYGSGFEEWGGDAPYWAINAHRMFAADMSVHAGNQEG